MKKLGVFLLVFGATALFNRAELSSVDEGFIFNTTAALVEKQSFQMDEQLSGRKYSRFSPLPSFFAAPFYAVADKVIEGPFAVGAAKKKDWLLFACGLASCFLTAWTAVALLGLLRSLNYSEDTAVWASLLWAFGTLAFPYSSSLFHQVMATLLMVYVVRSAFAANVAGTAIATALLVSVQLTLAATVLPLFLRDRGQWNRRAMIGLVVGVIGGFVLHVLTNWLRGDHWLHGAYETETFTTPTFVGTVGLFFSSGKGLLWFAPLAFVGLVMLLPFAHRRPEIGRPLLFTVACHCLVVIHWWAWHGSLSWGPRLLLPILPLLMIPIADLIERRNELPIWQPRLLGSVAAVSILINIWAATQPMIGFLEHMPNGSMSEWVFVPSLTPILQPWQWIQCFHGRVEGTIASKIALGMWIVFIFSGAGLVARRAGTKMDLRNIAPWRALAVCIPIFVISTFELAENTSTRFHGRLELPIRGVYRLEYSGPPDGYADIESRRLLATAPLTAIEAPPMSVSIDAKPADLQWTLPGEGQYRSRIPTEYFRGERGVTLVGEATFQVPKFRGLLLLLAVPLYFDWLLGARRMKEPSEPGTEANA